jgi:DNA helicase II / ATP-dependent DNA helicase PcrA
VTFTNKAAAEMKERVVRLAGSPAREVFAGTFHAFGAELLRQHGAKAGLPKRFAIADTGDQIALIRRSLRERRVDDRAFDARRVLARISRAKNAGLVPEALPLGQGDDYDLVTQEVFPLYQRGLRAQGAVDFDDLLLLPIRLFDEHDAVRAALHRRLRYLLVDEFQDTNRAQLEMVLRLAGERRNLCAVGDDDQSIYGWRGAELSNTLQFERWFPGAKVVRLEQNYRSSPPILEAANSVIEKNPSRLPKRLWTERPSTGPIILFVADDEHEEARLVCQEIAALSSRGLEPSDIAVLYRTNGQSEPFEAALREKNMRHQVIGGIEIFDRREVRDVVAYLKVIVNPRDELSLLRVVNVPARGIGDVTMERVVAAARARSVPVIAALAEAHRLEDLPPGAADRIREFCDLIDRYRKRFTRGNLAEVARGLLDEIGFAEAVRSNARAAATAERRVRSVEQVLSSIQAFEKRAGTDLLAFLNRLSLDTRDEEDAPEGGAISLMTLHAAKGLEFRAVFLVGVEEDLLPHRGMQGEPQNLEEERRLCYVGITRAREHLYLSRAATRQMRGVPVMRAPSRFIEDIPKELIEVRDMATPPGPPGEREKKFFSDLREKLRSQAPARTEN